MKLYFATSMFFCLSFFPHLLAQHNKELHPTDPLDTIFRYPPAILNDSKAFLIQEDSTYNFYIANIISLAKGYIIIARTKIDNYDLYAYIVTSKQQPKKSFVQQKIKKGKYYNLSLRRYFLIPAWVGIETVNTVDVMIGDHTITINECGEYTYLFTSFDLEGLFLLKDKETSNKNRKISIEQDDLLKKDICTFLKYISYNKIVDNLLNIVDTSQIKRSLNKYGRYFSGRNPYDFDYVRKKFEWNLDYHVKKYDWTEKDSINPNRYEEIFWKMLKKDYSLPIDSSFSEEYIYSNIQLKLLQVSDRLYTIQVIWKLPNVEKTYIAILNVQKTERGYRIIGFNRAYRAYRLYVNKGNEKFVPLQIW